MRKTKRQLEQEIILRKIGETFQKGVGTLLRNATDPNAVRAELRRVIELLSVRR